MTMPFSVRSQKEIADLRIGNAISFRMTVTKKDFWIDHVKGFGAKMSMFEIQNRRQTIPEIAITASARGRRDTAFQPDGSRWKADHRLRHFEGSLLC